MANNKGDNKIMTSSKIILLFNSLFTVALGLIYINQLTPSFNYIVAIGTITFGVIGMSTLMIDILKKSKKEVVIKVHK